VFWRCTVYACDTDLRAQRLEAPVRPEGSSLNVGPKVSDRQSEADELLKSDAANPDRALFNSDVRDVMLATSYG